MRLGSALLLLCLPVAVLAADRPHFGDAAIRCLQFVDENEGWAAGDDGAVWHSIDGGKNWERQPTGVRASLRGMHFLTPYSGWVVGREELPGGGSGGVVLGTSDGGLKWTVLSRTRVPGLNYVKFFSDRTGIAAGDGSETYPSGVFTTADGGRTWRPMPGVRNPTWLAGDFSDPDTGVLAGAWNRLSAMRDGVLGPMDVDSLGGRNVTGLKLNGQRAVAVGQGGLVMLSRDSAGLRWGFANLKLPRALQAAIDFHAVAVHESHIWAVGRPGSIVMHSADHGATWETLKTGQPVPLHAIHFTDEKRGWAAGEFGTILTTADGGKSWTVTKQGGMRAAVLFVHARAQDTPLTTVAALGGEEGYLAVSLGVTCPDPATLVRRYETEADRLAAAMRAADPARAVDPARLAMSMRLAGGASGEVLWQFPVAGFQDGGEPLRESWQKRHGESPADAMLRQLVLAFRTWRPEVVAVDGPGDELTQTLGTVVREAFAMADDPTAFPEQLEALGLEPWGAKKLLVAVEKPSPTAVRVDSTSYLPRLGQSADEYAMEGRRLWGEGRPASTFRLAATRLPDSEGHTKFFEGIKLAAGGAARREFAELAEPDAEKRAVQQRAHERKRNLQAMVDGRAGALVNPEQTLAQVADAIKELRPMDAGRGLFTVGTAYARTGQWAMAKEAYGLLLERHPGHPMSLEAARWLLRFQSSSEARHRFAKGQFATFTQSQLDVRDRAINPVAVKTKQSINVPESEVIQASHRIALDGLTVGKKWYQEALDLEGRLAAHGELFVRDVPSQLCLAAARRHLGKADASQAWLKAYIAESVVPNGQPAGTAGTDPWRDCVLLESWLTNRTTLAAPPKPTAACKKVSRPHLDGKLDDDCWKIASPVFLTSMAGDLGADFGCREAGERDLREKTGKADAGAVDKMLGEATRAAFAYDDEYLYVAIVCRHPAGLAKPKLDKRGRDADLRATDRVSILIDLDRDYQTYYQLQVDQRGAVAEDCWGDPSWNPKWFVAVNPEPTGWTAEVAIPLSELTGDSIAPGKLWAVNVVRTVPGRGVQAWSGPAGATPRPEGMGLMMFTANAGRK